MTLEDIARDLAADLKQMDVDGAIDLEMWPAAERLVQHLSVEAVQ
jgi:hypothetical protein